MSTDLQQLALMDALNQNWSGIQIRLGADAAALREPLAALAQRLATASGRDEAVALILDELLDLLEDTPAYEFVQDLVRGARFDPDRTRGPSLATTDFAPPIEHAATRLMSTTASQFASAVGAEAEACAIEVYFATNRQPAGPGEAWFSADPATGLTQGVARVTIPVARHRLGRLEQRPWWKPWGDKADPRRYVVLHDVEALSGAKFLARLAADAEARAGLLVFLHGYNVSFEAAARRAAQLASDLNFPGRVVLFSWPSRGTLLGYSADEERALLSAHGLRELLASLQGGSWQKLHLLAHSMGNRVVLHGLADGDWPTPRLDQVMFVAADVYTDLFRQRFPTIAGRGARYTSYASRHDRALFFSSLLHRAERVGAIDVAPFTIEGLETVDASAVDTGLLGLGHGYFAEQRSVLTDIGLLARLGLGATDRGLKQHQQPPHWRFPD